MIDVMLWIIETRVELSQKAMQHRNAIEKTVSLEKANQRLKVITMAHRSPRKRLGKQRRVNIAARVRNMMC